MQFDATHLSDCCEPFHPIDLEIGLPVTKHLYKFDQVRGAWERMTLEELLALQTIGRANHRAGPAVDMVDQPRSHRLVIAGEIEFCDWLSIPSIRPECLIRARNQYAHDIVFAACLRGENISRLCGVVFRDIDVARRCRRFGNHLFRWLVLAQPFERSLANEAVCRPPGELYLCDQLRFQPFDIGASLGRTDTGKGDFLASSARSFGRMPATVLRHSRYRHDQHIRNVCPD